MKILLAVDGSAHTKKMLAYLATHMETLGRDNEFTALTVEPPLPPRARSIVGKDVADSFHAESAGLYCCCASRPAIAFAWPVDTRFAAFAGFGGLW